MACNCPDRLRRLLEWMGYTAAISGTRFVLANHRGRIELEMDSYKHTTRLALMAIAVRLLHGKGTLPLPVA